MNDAADSRRRRRRRRDHAGGPGRQPPSGRTSRDGRYCITDVPPERWDPELYYDADPRRRTRPTPASAAGCGSSRGSPIAWRLPIPPKVAEQMDNGQQWAVSAARARTGRRRLAGLGRRPRAGRRDPRQRDRRREALPDLACASSSPSSLRDLQAAAVLRRAPGGRARRDRRGARTSVPRAASPRSPRTRCPASCPTSSPAGSPTCSTSAGRTSPPTPPAPPAWRRSAPPSTGCVEREYDAVITGGIDRNMGVYGFVKFCKIGALSATGTRPFDAGADGFVMGEGAALFVLQAPRGRRARRRPHLRRAARHRRLQRRQGQGHHRTQPGRPAARRRAGLGRTPGTNPASASAVEAHGTSTRVGDAAELASLTDVFGAAGARARLDRARLGQVQHRPPQGRGRRRRAVQDGAAPARQGARRRA